MHMDTKTRPWTRADLARLSDDGNRYEVLDGELLVTPQALPPHQWIASRLASILTPYVERHRLGWVAAPGGVVFGGNELQPDVEVVPMPLGAIPAKWDEAPTPVLVAEILSSGSRHNDLRVKPPAYMALAIPDYWVIDRFARHALVWRRGASEPAVATALAWQPRADLPELVIPLADILPPADAAHPADDED